jgi:heme/copper-type cytochrome/quinol oxidase subunit 2
MMLMIIDTKFFSCLICDAPEDWQAGLNEPASYYSMEGILIFNNHLLLLPCLLVGYCYNIIFLCEEFNNKFNSKFGHFKRLEIVWTTIPAIILLTLSIPSFTLLYAMGEISDFNSCRKNQKIFKLVCYMMVIDGLPKKNKDIFRYLETKSYLMSINKIEK